MPFPKKWIPVGSFLTVAFIIWLLKPLLPVPKITWDVPASLPQAMVPDIQQNPGLLVQAEEIAAEEDQKSGLKADSGMQFRPGTVKPVGYQYTKTLVVPRTKEEDVSWIQENFGGNEYIKYALYTVNDVDAELHPPKNKGNEVMVYLSYIIDHYNNLTDVNIFMHSHRYAWHNNELLDSDAVQMVSRLSAERIQREGYMNMRCHWDPGCPAWMHPGTIEEDVNKQEETMLAKSWSELFPLDPIPNVLAQPCCAQFAISRERIRSLPLSRYVFYRDWLLRTSLSNYISGRVWEYVWQFIFTGQNVVCPKEHICYCDGFGVCFGGEDEYATFWAKLKERTELEETLNKWNEANDLYNSMDHDSAEEQGVVMPEPGMDLELRGRIDGIAAWADQTKQRAKEHGDVAMNRAKEVGRDWQDGDGF